MGHNVVLPRLTKEYAEMESEERMHSESVENKLGFMKEYFEEIKKSDAILVINEGKKGIPNYIGGNTLIEMGIAYYLDKKIFLLNDIPEMDYRDEITAMQPVALKGRLEALC
ncbi:hypothetical protein HZA33_04385 [Candidatus Pacearchaeota archaeon]|nr:hypothetical protein [Candidatus Pacearchaeota archaeon]